MTKARFFFILILIILIWPHQQALASENTTKTCHIGAHPISTEQKWDPKTEYLVPMTEATFVQMLDSRNEEADCLLTAPYHVVASLKDGRWLRVLECSNTLVGQPHFSEIPKPPETENTPSILKLVPTEETGSIVIKTDSEPSTILKKTDVYPFIGPSVWSLPGAGIEGGVEVNYRHLLFGGVFLHHESGAHLQDASESACWDSAAMGCGGKIAPYWPCLVADFNHRAFKSSFGWGVELGFRERFTGNRSRSRFALGPEIGHIAYGSDFNRGQLINMVGIGFSVDLEAMNDVVDDSMIVIGIDRVQRPSVSASTQTVDVCWADYGNQCKSFSHQWPGVSAKNELVLKVAWDFWF